ncbi:transporter [Nitratifractor sp.]|uniref:transporter n=1 Tax=Nitratifractor sp. TaxID=2268144 RepID=UPI0025CE4874|nr:transporter [Nitratifractor sp.]
MKNRFFGATLAAWGLVATVQNLSAQVIPGIETKAGGMVVPQGKLVMGLKHIYFKRDSMFDGTHEVTNMEHLDATANVTLLALRYGIAKDTDLRLVIPYKQIRATAQLGPNDVAIDNAGIGDVIVMGKYRFYNDHGYQLAVGAGVKLPTGSTSKGFKKAPPFARGVNTPLPTQPGTGKAEYKLEFGASKIFDPMLRADLHAMYTYRPKAEHDYDFGNEFLFDVGVVKGITDTFNIGLEYNFKYNSSTDMGNDTNPMLRSKLPFKAFSGSAGYITPEIQYLPFGKPKLFFGAGVSFLVHKNLKEYQPLEKRRFLFRVGYMF